jgi:surface antigen
LALQILPLLAGLCLVAGCSVSMPMASLMPAPHGDEEPTGTILTPQLADWLGKDDWQQAKPAFAQALEEQKAAAVTWDNPKSGAKGTFKAVGEAYPSVSGRCRAFHADIDRDARDKTVEGIACADKSGSWQVTEIKPVGKS